MPNPKRRRRRKQRGTSAAPGPVATPPGAKPAATQSPPPAPRPAVTTAGAARLRALLGPLQPISLVLLIAACYLPALSAGLVWDDAAFTNAIPVREWGGLWDIWFVPGSLVDEGHYWPVLYSMFWLEHKLWGYAPLGYHIVNILLHVGVTLLLWHLLRRFGAPLAWVVAAIFAVHPVHVEPVVWVIGRKDVLSSLFYLAAAVVYLRFAQGGQIRDFLAVIVLFVAGMLSKSTVVTLPFVLLIWHWWRGRNFSAAVAARLLLLVAVGLLISLADWAFYKGREAVYFDFSIAERALLAARALWFYLGKLLWPIPLPVVYPRWDMAAIAPLTWLYLPAAVAFAAALWLGRHRIGRAPLAAVLCYGVILSPTLGFLDTGYMQFSFVADRYQYLAGAALIALGVGAAARALAGFGSVRITVPSVGVLLAALFTVYGTISWGQISHYRDNFTFYSYIVSQNPTARTAHYNLGREHRIAGRLEEAYENFAISIEKNPDYMWAHLSMGGVLEGLGRPTEAEPYYERAITINPNSVDALDHLAALRVKQMQYREALGLFQRLLAIAPDSAKFYSGQGVALYGMNRYEEALRSFDRALALNPDFTEARTNRDSLVEILEQRKGSE